MDDLIKNSKKAQCHYTIELSDAYRDNVLFFKKLVDKEFGVKPIICKKKQNSWRVVYSNKILARYLMKFFSVWPGNKSDDAFEPEAIRRCGMITRKAFALGLITFDGCITKQSKMTFTSKSKTLIDSLAEIWRKDGIKFGISKDCRNNFTINAYLENKKEKLLEYLEPNTQKRKLFYWLNGDLNASPVIHHSPTAKISEEKIFKLLKKVKNCEIIFLTNYFKCGQSTARYYLKTLAKQKKIILPDNLKSLNPEKVSPKTTVLLNKKYHKKLFNAIRKNFACDKEFANALGFKKATLLSWRKRKNRIPVWALGKMCNSLSLDLQNFFDNLIEEDREMISILYT
ncbi:MAG: hypothetical protein QXK06_04705 [Candidatus Diapherotrites archaeon]